MLLYRALAFLALAAYAPFALVRSWTGGRRLGDIRGRLGRRPYPDLAGGIWIHAVSVGEMGVARNLLRALRRRLPDRPIGISVTTAAGAELAQRTLSSEASLFAFPFELAGPIDRALRQTRPALVLLVETEIWPLFLARAAASGIPVAVVNGRISERSFARYQWVRRYLARSLSAVGLFAMQSEADARRIRELGAAPERVVTLGNVKYDLSEALPFPDAERLSRAAEGRTILVAGSTGEGEEERVLEGWRSLPNRPLLVLAPRRPERFDEVARLCESQGLRVLRRSTSSGDSRPATHDFSVDVYLLDSIGELASVYKEATLAFIGGSLVTTGGQNPIEAWAAGIPTLAGPHMENFSEIAVRGEELGILTRVRDSSDLASRLAEALESSARTAQRGAQAARFVSENRGAAERTAEALAALLPGLSKRQASAP